MSILLWQIMVRLILLCTLLLGLSACSDKDEPIKVLTVDTVQFIGDENGLLKSDRLAWNLDKDEVKTILAHAKPVSGQEWNLYQHFPCNINGKSVIKGMKVSYSVNAAGLIRLGRDGNGKLENFDWVGCTDPACFSFFLYQERGLD